jgi:hypothetical protein
MEQILNPATKYNCYVHFVNTTLSILDNISVKRCSKCSWGSAERTVTKIVTRMLRHLTEFSERRKLTLKAREVQAASTAFWTSSFTDIAVVGWGTMLQAGTSPVRVLHEVEFFNLPNTSTCTMALGSTQPLANMNSRNIPGGKKRPARSADSFATIRVLNV